MKRCQATNKYGRQCGNLARDGSDYCDVPKHAALGQLPGVDGSELPASYTVEDQGRPAVAPGAADDPWAGLDLPPDPGPEAEPAADQVLPTLPPVPDAIADDGAPDGDEDPALSDPGGWVAEIPEPPEADPDTEVGTIPTPGVGRWSPEDVSRFLRWTVNPKLAADGKDELSERELRDGGEALAPLANELLSMVDPSSPWGQAALWAALTIGPRYLPDVIARIRRPRGRSSGKPAAPAASSSPDPAGPVFMFGGA